MTENQIKAAFEEIVDEAPLPPRYTDLRSRPARTNWWANPVVAFAGGAMAVALLFAVPLLFDRATETDPIGTTPPAPPTTSVDTTPPSTLAPSLMMPDLIGLTVAEASQQLDELVVEFSVEPETADPTATIAGQVPSAGEPISDGTTVILSTESVFGACQDYEFEPPTPENAIAVAFPCDMGLDNEFPFKPVMRPLEVGTDPVLGTIFGLLAGPTDFERSIGFSSFFGPETADALISANLEDGYLVVDFNDAIYVNNATTSSGSEGFQAELHTNIFQYPAVDRIEFRINGSCEAWSAYFQSDGCWVIDRADWEARSINP